MRRERSVPPGSVRVPTMLKEGLSEIRQEGGSVGSLQEGRLRAVWAIMVTRNAANQATACLTSLRTGRRSPEAIVVVEHSPLEPIVEIDAPFVLKDQRKYGKTLVSFLLYAV